jgi:hypothetical protein
MVETTKDILSKISLSIALTAIAALSMPITADATPPPIRPRIPLGFAWAPLIALSMPVTAVGSIPPPIREQLIETFEAADLDEDGQLTRFEVKAGGIPDPIFRNFRRIDTNKSGTITLKETIIALNRGIVILRASSFSPRSSSYPAIRQPQFYGSQPQNY